MHAVLTCSVPPCSAVQTLVCCDGTAAGVSAPKPTSAPKAPKPTAAPKPAAPAAPAAPSAPAASVTATVFPNTESGKDTGYFIEMFTQQDNYCTQNFMRWHYKSGECAATPAEVVKQLGALPYYRITFDPKSGNHEAIWAGDAACSQTAYKSALTPTAGRQGGWGGSQCRVTTNSAAPGNNLRVFGPQTGEFLITQYNQADCSGSIYRQFSVNRDYCYSRSGVNGWGLLSVDINNNFLLYEDLGPNCAGSDMQTQVHGPVSAKGACFGGGSMPLYVQLNPNYKK